MDTKIPLKRKPAHLSTPEETRAAKRRKTTNSSSFSGDLKLHLPQNPNNTQNHNHVNGSLSTAKNGKINDVEGFLVKLLSSRCDTKPSASPSSGDKTHFKEESTTMNGSKLADSKSVGEVSDLHFLNALEKKLYVHRCQQSTVMGLDAGLYGVDSLQDMKVGLYINLHRCMFTINSSPTTYKYDHHVMRCISRSIDLGVLVPDLAAMLEDVQCPFYEGCVLLEVRDYRNQVSSGFQPTCHRVLLRPTQETLAGDLERMMTQNKLDLTDDEKILFEKKLLEKLSPPVCLEVSKSLDECRVLYGLSYNINKYNYRPRRGLLGRKSRVLPTRKPVRKRQSNLYSFLKKHCRSNKDMYSIHNPEFHKEQVRHCNHPLLSTASRESRQANLPPEKQENFKTPDINIMSHPIVPSGIPRPEPFIKDRLMMYKIHRDARKSRQHLQRANYHEVVRVEIKETSPGIFTGLVRVNVTPAGGARQTLSGPPIVFGIGSASAVRTYIKNLYLLEKDNLLMDNAVVLDPNRKRSISVRKSQELHHRYGATGRSYGSYSAQNGRVPIGFPGYNQTRYARTALTTAQMNPSTRAAAIEHNRRLQLLRAQQQQQQAKGIPVKPGPHPPPNRSTFLPNGHPIPRRTNRHPGMINMGGANAATMQQLQNGATRGPTTSRPTTRGHNPTSKRGMNPKQ